MKIAKAMWRGVKGWFQMVWTAMKWITAVVVGWMILCSLTAVLLVGAVVVWADSEGVRRVPVRVPILNAIMFNGLFIASDMIPVADQTGLLHRAALKNFETAVELNPLRCGRGDVELKGSGEWLYALSVAWLRACTSPRANWYNLGEFLDRYPDRDFEGEYWYNVWSAVGTRRFMPITQPVDDAADRDGDGYPPADFNKPPMSE